MTPRIFICYTLYIKLKSYTLYIKLKSLNIYRKFFLNASLFKEQRNKNVNSGKGGAFEEKQTIYLQRQNDYFR